MKSLTRGHLKAGIDSVRGAKLRNFWTMLGVIIGVASVISVVGIGEGIKQQIGGQVSHMAKNLIVVRPAQLQSSSSSSIGQLSGINVSGALSAQDVTAVTQAKGVGAVAPMSAIAGTATGDQKPYTSGLVIGTTADLTSLLNQSMQYGVFLTPDDVGNDVAVLGQNAAQALFSENAPLGRSFTFHGHQFQVRGVFNEFTSTPLSQEPDFNNAIFIPYDVAESLTNNTAPTYEILARANSAPETARTATAIEKSLSAIHGGKNGFQVLNQDQVVSSNNTILELLTRLIAGVAAISLLVGGIGIMNVMLVSVAERTHEIGIRKAVGATNRQILSQFVIESSLLSTMGGVIGIVIAFVLDGALRVLTDLRPAISWQVVALATGVSLAVGIIFGSIPALKAARKDPITALRSQ